MDDIVEVLTAQHHEVEKLLGQGVTAFAQMREVIPPHETAEEQVVYPAVKATGTSGQQIAQARLAEQASASRMLEEMSGQDRQSDGFAAMFDQLTTDVAAHARAEEAEVFPILRSLPDDQRASMAREFAAAQTKAQEG